jgi:hypothetical protein
MAESAAESPTEFDEQLLRLLGRCAAADSNALERLYELVSPILFACLTRILRRRGGAAGCVRQHLAASGPIQRDPRPADGMDDVDCALPCHRSAAP